MDMSSPWSSLDEPTVEMVRDREQDIVIHVGDALSGVDSLSVQIWVNSVRYDFGDYIWTRDTSAQGGYVRFMPEQFDVVFPPGESVLVHIFATDDINYCADNEHDTMYAFFVEPEVSCLVHPNPFTPNGDRYNPYAVFDYPYMFSEDADLLIYDLRNIKVFERKMNHVSDITDFFERNWEGLDNNGQPLPAGLYVWLIIRSGEVVCNGTVVIAR